MADLIAMKIAERNFDHHTRHRSKPVDDYQCPPRRNHRNLRFGFGCWPLLPAHTWSFHHKIESWHHSGNRRNCFKILLYLTCHVCLSNVLDPDCADDVFMAFLLIKRNAWLLSLSIACSRLHIALPSSSISTIEALKKSKAQLCCLVAWIFSIPRVLIH